MTRLLDALLTRPIETLIAFVDRLVTSSARERYAVGIVAGVASLLVGVAQVWPPGAWILGGLFMTGLCLVGLAGVRGSR